MSVEIKCWKWFLCLNELENENKIMVPLHKGSLSRNLIKNNDSVLPKTTSIVTGATEHLTLSYHD